MDRYLERIINGSIASTQRTIKEFRKKDEEPFQKMNRQEVEAFEFNLNMALSELPHRHKEIESIKNKKDEIDKRIGDLIIESVNCTTAISEELGKINIIKRIFGLADKHLEAISVIENKLKEVNSEIAIYKKQKDELRNMHLAIILDEGTLRRHLEYINHAKIRLDIEDEEKRIRSSIEAESEKVRALANAYVGKSRGYAETVKEKLERYDYCPYCLCRNPSELAADHIMPVSHGGLSTKENMIYVCKSCNDKKSDMTLREFCKEYNLDRNEIEQRLVMLGKRV